MFGSSTSRRVAKSSGFRTRPGSAPTPAATNPMGGGDPKTGCRICPGLAPSPAERITAMGAAAADGTFTALARFGFEERGVEIRKIFQLQARDLLPHETFDRLERCQFLAVHQGEGVARILSAAGPADAMDVIFRVLRHVVIDHVAYAGDVDSARGDIGRHHDFVFAALETLERLDPLALGPVRMHHRDGMLPGL